MKIIFAGTPINAASTLEALISSGVDVVGVLTRQDAKVGRSRTLTETPVAAVAAAHDLDTFKSNSISPEVEAWIDGKSADLGVIVAYGSILKKPVLDSPTKGWINLHYSLLPAFPGAAPVQHAILEGESMTGVTIFRLDEGMDTGPIIASSQLEIRDSVTSGDLLTELTLVGSELLTETLFTLEEKFSNQILQPKPSTIKQAGKITRSQARIDFSKPAQSIHNLVRAMNPEPIAWFELDNAPVRVLRTRLTESLELQIGQLSVNTGKLIVGCGAGALELIRVQPSGKNEMSGVDWFNGLRRESARIS